MTDPFNLVETRRRLIALRTQHRGNVPVTNRIGDAIDILEKMETTRRAGNAMLADVLHSQAIAKLGEIEQLKKDGWKYVPANHRPS
jgi:hypothetical protein